MTIFSIVITSVYKPPATPFKLPPLLQPHKNRIVIGHFNSHNIQWGYNSTNEDGNTVEQRSDSNQLSLVHDAKHPPFFNSARWKAEHNPDNAFVNQTIDSLCSANKLTLNTDKTLYVAFRTPNSLPPPAVLSIQFKNKHLKRVNSCKFLGLTINEHLSWKPHMQWLLQKLRCSYYVINKVKQYLDKSSLLTLYHSLIYSYVQYCVISWCHGNVSMIQKLQKVSTKTINLINTNKKKNSNVFQQHNLLTIQQSKQLEIAKFMHKYFNKFLPPAFSNIFDSNFLSEKATLRTRSKSELCPQYCRIKLTQRTLKFRGPMLWNKLPVALKDTKSLPKFIKCFKEYIINQ